MALWVAKKFGLCRFTGSLVQRVMLVVWVLSERNYPKMKATLTALTVAATMFASSASAFDPDDLQKLKDTGKCATCDLGGADLGGANLSGAYMQGAALCNTTMPDGSVINSGC